MALKRFDVVMGVRAWVLAESKDDAETIVEGALGRLRGVETAVQFAEAVALRGNRTAEIDKYRDWSHR